MLRIFLVEDEVVVRETIKKMIPWEQYGYQLVGEAPDGEVALPMIRNLKPDLLVTDIKMPFMDGLTLSKMVRKDFPDMKIVILSGYDDFNYAKQAINIGVEDYLLKPITKNAFLERLTEIRNRWEQEQGQKEYYEKFHREIQEYEKNSSRDFFEALVSGSMDGEELYKRADRLGLDIVAEAYNILIFSMESGRRTYGAAEEYSEKEARKHEKMEAFFLNNPFAMLFRNTAFSYAVLVKERRNEPGVNTEKCVAFFHDNMGEGREQDWFLAVGQPVERLSSMKASYHTASKAFARRYLYDGNILYYENMEQENTRKDEGRYLKKIDVNALNPAILERFLGSGLLDETEDFVRDYFQAIGHEAMESLVFRNYVILNVRFSVLVFLKKLGCEAKDLEEQDTEELLEKVAGSMVAAETYARNMIRKAILMRDENSGNKNRSILKSAIAYIDSHYMDEDLSLNTAAQVANISANHFSALFSQNMGQTFIEYLTSLRMRHARELLRCTGKRSSEIAAEVGYKDAHYFSYLFKKTQGMTPSEYRKTGEMRG